MAAKNPIKGDQLILLDTEPKPKKRGPGRPLSSDWVTTGVATQQLGISAKTLWKLREELFREGHHYRNMARPMAARPTYRWHLKRIEQLLEQPQEKRG